MLLFHFVGSFFILRDFFTINSKYLSDLCVESLHIKIRGRSRVWQGDPWCVWDIPYCLNVGVDRQSMSSARGNVSVGGWEVLNEEVVGVDWLVRGREV